MILPTFHRYLFHRIFWNFGLTLLVILGLTFTVDMVERLDKINTVVENTAHSFWPFVIKYYLLQTPIFLVWLLPVILLICSGLTIIQMIRNEEHIPFLSSGCSIYQLMIPIFLSCFLGVLLLYGLQGIVLPKISNTYASYQNLLDHGGKERNLLIGDDRQKFLKISKIDYGKKTINGITILIFDMNSPGATPGGEANRTSRSESAPKSMFLKTLITAEKGKWTKQNSPTRKQGWILTNGEKISYLPSGKRKGNQKRFQEEQFLWQTNLSPEKIRLKQTEVYFRSWNELFEMKKKLPRIAQIRVRIHQRLSYPFIAFFLPLFALPLLINRQTTSYWMGILYMGGIALGFYILFMLMLQLGNRGSLPPYVATWTPLILLITVELFQYDKILT